MSLCCECCVLSGKGLCDELITRPEESYRIWCLVECDLETSSTKRPWPNGGGVVEPIYINTGLFGTTVGVLTTCHTQYT